MSVLDGRRGFSTWFSMGGNKKYFLETDIECPGSNWYYFKTRMIVNGELIEMEQRLNIKIS